jgi:hypothetical protein
MSNLGEGLARRGAAFENKGLMIATAEIQTGPTTVTISERRDGRAIPVEIKPHWQRITRRSHSTLLPEEFWRL